MKKILYTLFAVLTMSLSFTACSGDDYCDETDVHDVTPEIASAGTYNGTWTVTNASTSEVAEYSGSVTLAAGETEYQTIVTGTCVDPANTQNWTYSAPANISWAGDNSFVFANTVSTSSKNQFTSTINGRIDDGALTFGFSKSVRVGRKTTTFYYVFASNK